MAAPSQTLSPTPASPAASPVHELFAYLCVRDVAGAVDFYARAFGAAELYRLVEPSGRIGHCEVRLGPSTLMLAEEFPEYGVTAPPPEGLAGVTLHLHVTDADAIARQAVAAGATLLSEPTDQFYGERSCKLRDPFGHTWLIGHSIESVSTEEMQRRYTAMFDPSASTASP
jgi:PhnB protein